MTATARLRHTREASSPYVSIEEAAELLDLSINVFKRQVVGTEVPLRGVGTDQVVARADLVAYLDRLAERARPEPLPAPGEENIVDFEPEDAGRPRVRDPWLDHVSEGASAGGRFWDGQARRIAEQHRRDVAEGAREAAAEAARIRGKVVSVGPGLDEYVGGSTEAAEDLASQAIADPATRAAIVRLLAKGGRRSAARGQVRAEKTAEERLKESVGAVLKAPGASELPPLAQAILLADAAHVSVDGAAKAILLARGGDVRPEADGESYEVEDYVPGGPESSDERFREADRDRLRELGRRHVL